MKHFNQQKTELSEKRLNYYTMISKDKIRCCHVKR